MNEQAEVGLLLAFPGICATLASAPLIIPLLYSGQFGPADGCLAVAGARRLPEGRVLAAGISAPGQGKGPALFLDGAVLQPAACWADLGLRPGVGTSGNGNRVLWPLYLLLALMWIVTRRLSGFAWSMPNKRVAAVAIPTVAFVFLCPVFLPSPWDVAAAAGGNHARGTLCDSRAARPCPAVVVRFAASIDRMERIRAAGSESGWLSPGEPWLSSNARTTGHVLRDGIQPGAIHSRGRRSGAATDVQPAGGRAVGRLLDGRHLQRSSRTW